MNITSEERLGSRQFVILKADDLSFGDPKKDNSNWEKFFTYIINKGLKTSVGIIGECLKKEEASSVIGALSKNDCFEFWNHGYSYEHKKEFLNSPYEKQKKLLTRTQDLGKERLGITFRAFGAPRNAINEDTRRVVEEDGDIKIWLNGSSPSSKLVLTPWCELEFKRDISSERFIENYSSRFPYLLLQCHPWRWSEKMFSQFNEVVDFLLQEQVEFITPYEYFSIISEY